MTVVKNRVGLCIRDSLRLRTDSYRFRGYYYFATKTPKHQEFTKIKTPY